MPAAYFALQRGDMFKNAGNAQHLVKIPEIDAVMGAGALALYTSVSLRLGETIQYFLTFDDVIKFIHFGKGVGTLSVEGLLLCDIDGDLPGIHKYYKAIGKLRGESVTATVGPVTMTVVMTDVQNTIMSDPDTMSQFTVNFSVVNHNLKK